MDLRRPAFRLPGLPGRSKRRRWLGHVLAVTMFAVASFLAVTSAFSASGTDLRANRQSDLSDLVRSQVREQQQLEETASQLRAEIDRLSEQVAGVHNGKARDKAARLGRKVGLTPVHGSGITVTLNDAPPEVQQRSPGAGNALIVHQQDIQAVANALWAAGAEAMTIQDQRIISTSAIRCVGNSVVLHGVPYPPPYRITAIGNVDAMLAELSASPGVARYLRDAQRYQLGYEIDQSENLRLPAYTGGLDLAYAKPGAS